MRMYQSQMMEHQLKSIQEMKVIMIWMYSMHIASHIYSPEPIKKIDAALILADFDPNEHQHDASPALLNCLQVHPLLSLPFDVAQRAQSPPISPVPPGWLEERPESGPALVDPFPLCHRSPSNEMEQIHIKNREGREEALMVKHKKERKSDKSLPTITVDEYCFGMNGK